MLTALGGSGAEKARSHCPALTIVCKNRYRFFVVPDDYATDKAAHVWLKGDALTDAEAKHGCVGSCMLHKTEPLNNPVVEINELGFSEFVDIDDHEV